VRPMHSRYASRRQCWCAPESSQRRVLAEREVLTTTPTHRC
jgi:hypothetical protein